jgi:hypothetical protein
MKQHPLDKFAKQVERGMKRNFKYTHPLQLALVVLIISGCQAFAPLTWFKKEPIYLEKMTPSNVSLINSDPETFKYNDNDEYLPPIDLSKKPDIIP